MPDIKGRLPTLVLASCALAALAGCVDDGSRPLNGDIKALSPEEIRLQQVETKVAELSRRLDGIQASSNSGGSQVSDDLRSLRGDVETLRHDFDQAQQQNQAQFQAINQRLGGVAPDAVLPPGTPPPAQTGTGTPASPPVASITPTPPVNVGTAPPAVSPSAATAASAAPASGGTPAAQEDAAYKANIAALQAQRYDDAVRGFRAMLDQYPQGSYADNAWYWLGQTYNVKGDYANSAQAYESLLQRFPASPKVPDAMLSLGLVDLKLNKRDEAKAMLQKVVHDYPNSRAASMANGQLSQLR